MGLALTGSSVPVRRRLVAVEADFGEGSSDRWHYGSGLLIGGRRVLTAAHVVEGATSVTVRRPTDDVSWTADLDGALIGTPARLDLAMLEVSEADLLGAVPVAVVNRDVVAGEFVENCWAVGYPAFQEVARDNDGRSLRETAEVRGQIPPLSNLRERLLSLHVTNTPRSLPSAGPLDVSEWSGMSGAAVFAGELLVGVVTEQSPKRGPSDVTVTPLDRLLDPEWAPSNASEWWACLGVADPAGLPRLPFRSPPAYHSTLRVIRKWTPVLFDRDSELSRIKAFATGASEAFGSGTEWSGYVWLVARPWAGKTALLAEAVDRLSTELDVAGFFLSARDSQASREQFLAAVVPQLAWLLDESIPSSVDVVAFRDLWARAATRAETYGRHLLLVVDGLDEDLRPGGPSVAAALPTENLGDHARVLVASRPYPGLPDDVQVHHPLRSVSPVPLVDSPHAAELRALAEQELRGLLRQDSASDLAFDVVGLLAAAGGPLSLTDFAQMIESVKARDIRAFVTDRAARSLQPVDADGHRRFRFSHQTLLEISQNDPTVGHDPDYRNRLRQWAEGWRERGWPVSEEAIEDTPRYLLDSYPAALAEDGERLATLVCDIGWLDTAVLRIGVDRVLATLREATRLCTSNTGVASTLRFLQLQAHHLRSGHKGPRSGQTATQLAWEALRGGAPDIACSASERLHRSSTPQLIPVWTTERTSPNLTRVIGRHGAAVRALAVYPEGKVVSGHDDGALRLWDPNLDHDRGQEVGRHGAAVGAVAVTPDGKVVSGDHDGVVRLWNPDLPDDKGRELGRHNYNEVGAVVVLPDGKVMSGGGAVRVWDPNLVDDPGREIALDGWGFIVAVTPQGQVACGDSDGVVRICDPTLEDDPGRALGRHDGPVWAVAVTPEGGVVSGGGDGVVRFWDPNLEYDPGRALGRHEAAVRAVAVTPEGSVVSGGYDGVVRLWDPNLTDDSGWELGRLDDWVRAVAVTPQGKILSGGEDGVVRLWDPSLRVGPGQELRQFDQVRTAAITPEGNVVSGHLNGAVRLWDPNREDDPGREVGYHGAVVWAVAVTPQGKVVSGGADGVVRLWDPNVARDPGRALGSHYGSARALAITPEGRIVSGGEDVGSDADGVVVRMWDPNLKDDSGRQLGRYDSEAWAVAVTPEGKVVSAHVDGAVRLWNPELEDDPGRELGRHDDWVRAVAVTAEGKVVSGGQDRVVRLWNPDLPDDRGRELGRHDVAVFAVAITADGKVVSSDMAGVVRLWDTELGGDSGRELGRHDERVYALAVGDGGRVVIATGLGLTLCRLTTGRARE